MDQIKTPTDIQQIPTTIEDLQSLQIQLESLGPEEMNMVFMEFAVEDNINPNKRTYTDA